MICDLWGDPKTGMPVRIENSAPSNPNMKPTICSDFVIDGRTDARSRTVSLGGTDSLCGD
jgi:hypothetical protein